MTTTASNTLAALRLRFLASVAAIPASARPKPSLPSYGVHWGTIKIRGPKSVKTLPNPPMSGPCTGSSSAKLNPKPLPSSTALSRPLYGVLGPRARSKGEACTAKKACVEGSRGLPTSAKLRQSPPL
ncbi:hypothetical protein NEUTE1DRAFT_141207 [Neurospora tetrasperma FGSC 2508]|uniref:Uncharacterized protein n=1 Tax=Neurospora tetrasperma (strain FGSC 2508 / ATCC MYA-4615 / P0657) TaxID=510951 RepID=F8MWJ9_NEUT8|nr:uncharacterized protein NEUTE1DRAFT_141207 [Neurospora tetrasperma FGSC 2508]EGO54941.1 hypothetical protein NEUTE1DRAFT_141207 [Neurospora tetrasperma FGSC 2508]EGZ67567.1 hypothetical protein NEUTE2DRAFT_169434 [Neurospora tetrasperma FGSC 2509]